ncbi:hypothetical protein [Prosthecobacter sp.]|uniref:hypothetical protein n=1 Tax=Prosthecobacter sp. TaxID=1965333 RepID=UPI0037847E59
MKRRLFALITLAAAVCPPSSAAPPEPAPPLEKKAVRDLIREVAAKIEEKYKGIHPDADGLVQRVEETLAADEPAPPDSADRRSMLARKMTLMNGRAGFNSMIGTHGAVFDNTDTGFMQRYHDLESADTKDAAEVWRWLEMGDAARHLKWHDKEQQCAQRALGAARALISREPKNAEAYALLGMALEWSSEKLTALRTALKLDPREPQALHELLCHRVMQVLESAALRRDFALEEKETDYTALARALYDRPLSEEEFLAFDRRQEELRRELANLLSTAQERHDLRTYLKSVSLLSLIKQHRMEATLAARRPLEESFEEFSGKLALTLGSNAVTVFEDETLLRNALNLAADDAEATGTIILLALIGDSMRSQTTQKKPPESRMEIVRQTSDRLLEMSRAEQHPQAARAAEAAFIIEVCMMMISQREPKHFDLLLRAIHLDPFRQRTQHMLMGLCAGMLPQAEDSPAAAALALTELALLPGLQTRRTCSATAAVLHDWPSAHHHIDACLKEKPDDLGLLNQQIVTMLRESQSKATLKKAELHFQKAEALHEKSNGAASKEDLSLLARSHILYLAICGKNDAAHEELAEVKRAQVLDGRQCEELEELLR